MASNDQPCCYRACESYVGTDAERAADPPQLPFEPAVPLKLYCTSCRKAVSTVVPDGTVVRACIMCPECWHTGAAERDILEWCESTVGTLCGWDHPATVAIKQRLADKAIDPPLDDVGL